jgi:UDP-N-acetyl-D-glucosamine/UDP-N-acetyl-D-galactosamine dehydrogenase
VAEQQILKIAVIGLGYVGLPLAVEFGKHFTTVGFDIKPDRIAQIRDGLDVTREVSPAELARSTRLSVTGDVQDIRDCNFYVVTVPTPIDASKRPDLAPLLAASQTVGGVLKPGDTVVYESTVYPGATEEDCVPVLAAASGLQLNRDFHVGYSPERINPGDKTRRLTDIVKVTSGSTPQAAEMIDRVYRRIVPAGTYKAESIRVAEAAKVIENTQRDLNIALMNELAIIFSRMGIDTEAVLNAAATKWNFLRFRPGLVGGHCIGVDPYYLTHKAEASGYSPQIILAGRRLNDGMAAHVAGQLVKTMLRQRIAVQSARVLIMGLTFKENCPDLRNTKVIDVVTELQDFGIAVDVHDPWADPVAARTEYGIDLVTAPAAGGYDGIVVAVAHDQFRDMGAAAIRVFGADPHVLYDLKNVLAADQSDLRL